jgi:hypothetical protein
MVYALHKFRHFLFGNKFVFYVEHMVFVYLVNKPQVSKKIARWMLFLKYEFTIVYKPNKTRVVVDVLSRLLNWYLSFPFLWLVYSYCYIVSYIIQIYARGKLHGFPQYMSPYSIYMVVFHWRLLLVLAFY